MSVVIYSEGRGVYLGRLQGVGLWSGVDPCAQDCAPVFKTPQEAYEHIHAASPGAMPHDVVVSPVVSDIESNGGAYASVSACVNAGLPGWLTEVTVDIFDRYYGERPSMH